jgi:uncharacterized membrane protein
MGPQPRGNSFVRIFNRSARARLLANRSGSIAAEFALVVPILLLLTFSIIEFGRFMWTQNVLQSAVEDAARCSALNRPGCTTAADVQTYAVSKAAGLPVSSDAFQVTDSVCGSSGKLVEADYAFTPIVPFVPLNFSVTASACRPQPT